MGRKKAIKAGIADHAYKDSELKEFIKRIENIDDEVARNNADAASDRKQVFADAKSAGFHGKILRKILTEKRRIKAELDLPEGERACLSSYRATAGVRQLDLFRVAGKKNKPAAEPSEQEETTQH